MSVEDYTLLNNLPFLRRYARALTGSQTRGDNYVRLCLEAILAEPTRSTGADAKVELFKVFHNAFGAVDRDVSAFGDQPRHKPDTRSELGLGALPPLERQVLLLTCLEEFSVADTAAILDIDISDAERMLAHAREQVQLVSSVPIMIIEDEPMIAMELARIVRDMGHHVCATAARQSEAIKLAADRSPSLILADIQLKGDDSGIIAVQEILKQVEVPIIFVTGFPERLLTGESLEPAFIIPKPFSSEMLRAAIGQALSVVGEVQSRRVV